MDSEDQWNDKVSAMIKTMGETMATDIDAGNYESVIVYDATTSKTPEAIRASVRAGAPFRNITLEEMIKHC